jgi:uncharacterized protein (DUF4415 family)
MTSTGKASLEELKALRAQGELSPPAEAAPAQDMPEGFWDQAQPQMPRTKTPVNLRVDPDILDFFKAQGAGHLTRMHAVLRAYVDAQKKHSAGS